MNNNTLESKLLGSVKPSPYRVSGVCYSMLTHGGGLLSKGVITIPVMQIGRFGAGKVRPSL
ncbi:hypothetical protein FNH22_12905 [Fulvivirga sp. M361]|uniref:hypothetical protein n=1 Tax=Fulvivirga sp. M361 TaxID=2594266 RepID=UPI00117AE12D|nr:hypothetical protein [Fulvivirga sp. M361]TRX58770.1 hypothetical protein FNH22_12905 [Fulvivirga sp. M361]